MEWDGASQGLKLDFRLTIPNPEGLTDHLAELKFISAGVSWFLRGVAGKGTDRRGKGCLSNTGRSWSQLTGCMAIWRAWW